MNISKGRILYSDNNSLYKSIGYNLYLSVNNGESWTKIIKIKRGGLSRIIIKIPVLRRLLRRGIHKVLKYDSGFIIFCEKTIYRHDSLTKQLSAIGRVHGSRPLYPCVDNNILYYGEYKSNINRESIFIYKFDINKGDWEKCHKLDGIRHVHGIFTDPYLERLWLTTGDLDTECKILYTTDGFNTVNVFAEGSQTYRAIYLHFTEDSIIYGTDAPDEVNYIYEVNRSSGCVLSKTKVGGPVFYGAISNNYKLLSTAVEPSKVNTNPFMELWLYTNKQWKRVYKEKKDILPKKYFQYGQLVFGEGRGSDSFIAFTPIAGKLDEKVVVLNLNEVCKV